MTAHDCSGAGCAFYTRTRTGILTSNSNKRPGTTLFLFFGGYCNNGPNSLLPDNHPMKRNCLSRFAMKEVPNPEAAQALWKEYFVFTVSRNPYSRAGSAYDYMLGRRQVSRTGACSDPPFTEFCKNPSIIGKQDRLFGCTDELVHDFYHVEPLAQCVTTEAGLPAVDFVLR